MCCLRVQAEEAVQRICGPGGGSMAQEAMAGRTVVLNGIKPPKLSKLSTQNHIAFIAIVN